MPGPRFIGPPVPGAPWSPFANAAQRAAPKASPKVSPQGQVIATPVPRVNAACPRQRRFSENVSQIINSLVTGGFISETGSQTFSITKVVTLPSSGAPSNPVNGQLYVIGGLLYFYESGWYLLSVNYPLTVPMGGTGNSLLPPFQVLLGNGVNSVASVVGLGTAAQVLTSNGPGAAPTWQSASGGVGGSGTGGNLAAWTGSGSSATLGNASVNLPLTVSSGTLGMNAVSNTQAGYVGFGAQYFGSGTKSMDAASIFGTCLVHSLLVTPSDTTVDYAVVNYQGSYASSAAVSITFQQATPSANDIPFYFCNQSFATKFPSGIVASQNACLYADGQVVTTVGFDYWDGSTLYAGQSTTLQCGETGTFKGGSLASKTGSPVTPVSSVTGDSASGLTSSGGTTPQIGFSNQSPNTALLGPASGASAKPTFRGLVPADVAAAVPPSLYLW